MAAMDELRILVTGSRDWTDRDAIRDAIRQACRDFSPANRVVVVHGAARGADALAESVARGVGLDIERHPADWDRLGKRAGFVRNAAMVEAGADVCLAFIKDKSRGATHTARVAEKAGIPVRRFVL